MTKLDENMFPRTTSCKQVTLKWQYTTVCYVPLCQRKQNQWVTEVGENIKPPKGNKYAQESTED